MPTLKNILIVLATVIVVLVVTGIGLSIGIESFFAPYMGYTLSWEIGFFFVIWVLSSSAIGLFVGWLFLRIIRAESDISAATLAGLLTYAIASSATFLGLFLCGLSEACSGLPEGLLVIVYFGLFYGLPLVVALIVAARVYKRKKLNS
jgi:hypothetical protein